MIILLGLQIIRVANQLINGSTTLPAHRSLPIYDSSVHLHKILLNSTNSKSNDLNKNESKIYLELKSDFYKNFDNISKRYNELKTFVDSNRELSTNKPQEIISKYSKHKVIAKPHPFSQRVENPNEYQNTYLMSDSDVESDDRQESEFIPQTNSEKQTEKENRNLNNDNKYVVDYKDLDEFNDFDGNEEFDDNKNHDESQESDMDYIYKEEETPECASGHSFCDYDDNYPQKWIQKSIDKQMSILTQMMPESTETFDLVEGIPKETDENYTYSESPVLSSDEQSSDDNSNENNIQYTNGGYICPSLVDYIQPKRAQNNEGLWKVILNMNESYRGIELKQHFRLEECQYESMKCSFAPNYYKSLCVQKYSNERLLAWTPDKGIHLDVFRLPIACSCHLTPNE